MASGRQPDKKKSTGSAVAPKLKTTTASENQLQLKRKATLNRDAKKSSSGSSGTVNAALAGNEDIPSPPKTKKRKVEPKNPTSSNNSNRNIQIEEENDADNADDEKDDQSMSISNDDKIPTSTLRSMVYTSSAATATATATATVASIPSPTPVSTASEVFDRYKIQRSPGSVEFVAKFVKFVPNQRTAATYHLIGAKEFVSEESQVKYIRNQLPHLFSNLNNNFLAINESHLEIFLKKVESYNVGANQAFGVEFVQKLKDERALARRKRRMVKKNQQQAMLGLTDRILEHKFRYVEGIVLKLNTTNKLTLSEGKDDDETQTPVVVALNQSYVSLQGAVLDSKSNVNENAIAMRYPCLIVRLNEEYSHHKEMKARDTTHEYGHAYTSFATHLLIAFINKHLIQKKIGPLFYKRQSFGFLTPTASDVDGAIRLSFGLVPNDEWSNCIVSGIHDFNKCLNALWKRAAISPSVDKNKAGKKIKMYVPHRFFNTGDINIYGYKLFLMQLLKSDKDVDNIISCINQYLKDGLKYDELKVDVVKSNFFKTIFDKLSQENKFDDAKLDGDFKAIFNDVYRVVQRLNTPSATAATQTAVNFQTKSISDWLKEYETLLDRYKVRSVKYIHDTLLDDKKQTEAASIEATSESELDLELAHNRVNVSNAEQKYYSPVGMSSLVWPVIVLYETLNKKPMPLKIEPYAYFELSSLEKVRDETLPKKSNYNDAIVVCVDNNPCVNGQADPIPVIDSINKWSKAIKDQKETSAIPRMLEVDITSSTQRQIKDIIIQWEKSNIALLCLAKSGLKNDQLGLDLAQYGYNKLIINKRYIEHIKTTNAETGELLERNCNSMANNLRKMMQGSSSAYADYVRRDLRDTAASVLPSAANVDPSSQQVSHVTTAVGPYPQPHTISPQPSVVVATHPLGSTATALAGLSTTPQRDQMRHIAGNLYGNSAATPANGSGQTSHNLDQKKPVLAHTPSSSQDAEMEYDAEDSDDHLSSASGVSFGKKTKSI